MWADCRDRTSTRSCGECAERDACAELFPAMLARFAETRRRERQPDEAPPGWAASLFLTVMGEVARGVERNVRMRQERMERDRAAPAAERAPPDASAVSRQIDAHLEPLLASGEIGIDSVARVLGLSRQTLYRRLKAEGTTFEQVLDGLRHRLALRFIEEDGMAVKEAAWRLGFSDPAAFSRAFKRWTGRSPGATRH
jgi:AraC-like DNA-binding protein